MSRTTVNDSEVRCAWSQWFWLASFCLLSIGAKFWLIHHFVVPLPTDDQWDGEGGGIYLPWFEHRLTWAHFFIPHNEHRIVFTRLLGFALLLLNGQWDNELQAVVNVFIHTAAIGGFGWLMARWMGKQNWPLIWLAMVLAVVVPFAWENTLSGFQSQFYFALIASLLTIALLGREAPFSRRWWLGAIAAIAALFTVASGMLASAAVILLLSLDIMKDRAVWRRYAPTLVLCGAIIIIGLLLTPHIPPNDALKAQSVHEFLMAFGRNLAWPRIRWPSHAFISLVPLGMLLWVYFRSRNPDLRAERMLLGVGFWVFLQCAAAAYKRGLGGVNPAPRYMDLLCFMAIANWLAIILLLTRHHRWLRWWPVWYLLFIIWGWGAVGGLLRQQRLMAGVYAFLRMEQTARLQNTREFLRTDDPVVFANKPPSEIPYPHPDRAVELLRTPALLRLLPPCVLLPRPIVPAPGDAGIFTHAAGPVADPLSPDDPGWTSYANGGGHARGKFESAPIQASALPYLEIPIVGDMGAPGLTLQLVEISSGKITEVRRSRPPGDHWAKVRVRAPRGDYKIVAQDDSDTGWFAFKEPQPMGRLSFWAATMDSYWRYFLDAGAICFVVAMAGWVMQWRQSAPRAASA